MHKLRTVCTRPVFGLIFVASCLVATGASVPPPERLLPDDTLVIITAPDFTRLKETWHHLPQSQLWDDPAMRPFRESFVKNWNEQFIKPLERELDIKCSDYLDLLKGQLTLAVIQNGWQGGAEPTPGVVLVLDTKDRSSELTKTLGALRKKWVDAGKALKTTRVRDFEFTSVPISTNDVPQTLRKFFPKSSEVRELGDEKADPASTAGTQLLIGQVDSLLVVGSSMPSVEKIVARATGGSIPPLAEAPGFQAAQAALFRNAPLYGWINLKTFVDVLTRNLGAKKENADAPNPFEINPAKILGAIGLNGLKTLGFSFQQSNEGSIIQVSLGVPESSRQGIFKILAGEPRETRPPAFVPADAVKFQRWRIDGQKSWQTLQKVINDISPQWLNGINFLIDTANNAAKEKDPGFDLKKNLIGNLGDDWISYEKAPRGNSPADLRSPPSLVLVGSPNAESFASAFKSILVYTGQQPGGQPDEREFLGRKVYSVPLRAMMLPLGGAGAQGMPQNLTYAAGGGYVAFSSDPALVEEYLRTSEGQHNALREKNGLSEAAQKVIDPGSSLFGYENQAETTKAVLQGLGTNAAPGNPSPLPAGMMPSGLNLAATIRSFKDLMDFSQLPPYESIAKYFYFTVYGGSANVDGLTFKVFSPVPPGIKAAAQN